MRIKTLETFGSYAVKLFEEVLRNAFGDPNDQRSNEQRMQNLRQTTSATN